MQPVISPFKSRHYIDGPRIQLNDAALWEPTVGLLDHDNFTENWVNVPMFFRIRMGAVSLVTPAAKTWRLPVDTRVLGLTAIGVTGGGDTLDGANYYSVFLTMTPDSGEDHTEGSVVVDTTLTQEEDIGTAEVYRKGTLATVTILVTGAPAAWVHIQIVLQEKVL